MKIIQEKKRHLSVEQGTKLFGGYSRVKPFLDAEMRQRCKLPYPNHPKGCPNFGKSKRCPPQAKILRTVADFSQSFYVIWNEFDFGKHVRKMKDRHPEWSERQARCCLYWQGTAQKQLREWIADFKLNHHGYDITQCPEAMGVNVTATMLRADVVLEWPPENIARQVALAYVRKARR